MASPTAYERCIAAHRDRWGAPQLAVRAPGRVNLIGEHTDYNDGFTLPMALPLDTVIVADTTSDGSHGPVTVWSEGFGEVAFDPAGDPSDVADWARHLAGVVALLGDAGVPAGGWRAVVASDIPTGAGLSSSAAIEVAAITLLLARAGSTWPAVDVARLGQRVENEVVGLPSGIMDQLISAGALDGHAGLMDCRTLSLTPAPLPDGVVVAVLDTGTRRVLAEAAYADRRTACARAARQMGVAALRDATIDDLARVTDATDRRRATHVIGENARTLAAAAAMREGDSLALARLMDESHRSLHDDFEVSSPALDSIVEVARVAPGCLGARMTGGGFAGCAVALIRAASAERFTDHVVDRYDHDGHRARVWICRPAPGASMLPLPAPPAGAR